MSWTNTVPGRQGRRKSRAGPESVACYSEFGWRLFKHAEHTVSKAGGASVEVYTSPPNEIGPSTSSWRMASAQLSFALQHHLVQAHLARLAEMTHAKHQRGFRTVNPIESKFGVVGRINELPSVEELAVQHFILLGSRISSHSALVGKSGVSESPYEGFAGPARDSYIDIGLNRLPVQTWVDRRCLELLEDFPLDDTDFAVAKDRLLLCYVSQAYMGDNEIRKRVAARLVHRGLRLLEHADCDESSRATVINYLGELAREELNTSLRLGAPSSILPSSLHTIFPTITSHPPTLRPITPSEYLLIATPSNEPLYASTRTAIFLPIIERETFLLLHLAHRSSSSFTRSIHLAWSLLEESQAFIDIAIRTVVGIGLSPGKSFSVRESDFIWWSIVFDSSILDCFAVCDYVVLAESAKGLPEAEGRALMRESESRLSHARVLYARHADVLMSLARQPVREEMARARKVALPLILSRGPSLMQWCGRYPAAARILLRIVTYAAHGEAQAARLAVEMRAAIPEEDVGDYPGDVGNGKEHVKGAERWASSARVVVDGALAELTREG